MFLPSKPKHNPNRRLDRCPPACTSGKPLIYFSMLFMLFHAFLSKKSTLFEKHRLLVTSNPLYFSCAFCAFLDIFLEEHWIFGPFLVLLVLFCSIRGGFGPNFIHFGLFGPFLSIFGHFFCPFLDIWLSAFLVLFLSSLTSTKKVEGIAFFCFFCFFTEKHGKALKKVEK